MKSFSAAIACMATALILPVTLNAAADAQVVSEDPNGARITRGGTQDVVIGMNLMEGDILRTSGSTLILSLCEGSLLTVYPDSVLELNALSGSAASLNLVRGELLGDAAPGATFSVETKAGTATITNGVYGVVHNAAGQNWTLQVRNLDGSVTFTGDLSLDTSNMTTSLLEPGQTVAIPAGEEIVIRGVYNEASGIFSLEPEGVAIAELSETVSGTLQQGAQYMSSVFLDFQKGGGQGPGGGQNGNNIQPFIIEVPIDDVETASDSG